MCVCVHVHLRMCACCVCVHMCVCLCVCVSTSSSTSIPHASFFNFQVQHNFVLSEIHLEGFQAMWGELDTEGTGKLPASQLQQLLERLHSAGNPLGSVVLANEFKYRTGLSPSLPPSLPPSFPPSLSLSLPPSLPPCFSLHTRARAHTHTHTDHAKPQELGPPTEFRSRGTSA